MENNDQTKNVNLKQELAELLDTAKDMKIGLVHIFNKDNPFGGLSVAFKPVNGHKNTRMVEVAVAVCSSEDRFSRRIGAYNALNSFLVGYTIQLPILESFLREDLNFAVKLAFTEMYKAIGKNMW